ncbi:MAG: hypothetical protein V1743_04255 [Nanoarchaeota archaeon]
MDDYELVAKDEIQSLRDEIKRFKMGFQPAQPSSAQQSPAELRAHQQDQPSFSSDTGRMVNLYNSMEKLNESVTRLLTLFQRAQIELIKDKSSQSPDKFLKLESQNEKIANGIISMVNMIKDQQLQLNQLNTLYGELRHRMEDTLPKRRDFTFKIPPGYGDQQSLMQGQPLQQPGQKPAYYETPDPRLNLLNAVPPGSPVPRFPDLSLPSIQDRTAPFPAEQTKKEERTLKMPVIDILMPKKDEPALQNSLQQQEQPIPLPPQKKSFLDRFRKR